MKNIFCLSIVFLLFGCLVLLTSCGEDYTPPPPTYYNITAVGVNAATITITAKGAEISKAQVEEIITLTAEPPANYAVNFFEVNRVDNDVSIITTIVEGSPNSRTFIMPATDVEVLVFFYDTTATPHTLTVSQSPEDGILTPNPSGGQFVYGQRVEFTITPPMTYKVESITLDGNPITMTGNRVMFFMPAAEANLEITYEEIGFSNWEDLILEMYPGAYVLPKELEAGSTQAITVVDNVISYDGSDFNPRVQFTIPNSVRESLLTDYEALLVVAIISDINNTRFPEDEQYKANIMVNFRGSRFGSTEIPFSFFPAEGSGFMDGGVFFFGRSGSAYQTFATYNSAATPPEGRGFNIQIMGDTPERRTAFNMTIEAIVLLPKRSETVMNSFGPNSNNTEFNLDPTLFEPSRIPTTESIPVYDWIVLSGDWHIRYNMSNTINIPSTYDKMVIDYTFLFSNRVPPNESLGEQHLAVMNSDHGRTPGLRIGESAALERVFGTSSQVEIPLAGGASWSPNPLWRIELACVHAAGAEITGGRILFKLNSIKLVKNP